MIQNVASDHNSHESTMILISQSLFNIYGVDTVCDGICVCDNASTVLFTNNASTNDICDCNVICDCSKKNIYDNKVFVHVNHHFAITNVNTDTHVHAHTHGDDTDNGANLYCFIFNNNQQHILYNVKKVQQHDFVCDNIIIYTRVEVMLSRIVIVIILIT